MTMFQVLPKVIRSVKLFCTVALPKLVDLQQVPYAFIPILISSIGLVPGRTRTWKVVATISACVTFFGSLT